MRLEKGGYGVNIHDTKMSFIQVNSKQRNNTLIVVLHFKVTLRPSTQSKNLHLTVSKTAPSTGLSKFFARCRKHYIWMLKHTNAG